MTGRLAWSRRFGRLGAFGACVPACVLGGGVPIGGDAAAQEWYGSRYVARHVLSAASRNRVSFIGSGDSNQLYPGFTAIAGLHVGFENALKSGGAPMFASPLIGPSFNRARGYFEGGPDYIVSGQREPTAFKAGNLLDRYRIVGSLETPEVYLPGDVIGNTPHDRGLVMLPDGDMGVDGPFEVEFHLGLWPAADVPAEPQVRLQIKSVGSQDVSFDRLASVAAPTPDEAFTMERFTIVVPHADRGEARLTGQTGSIPAPAGEGPLFDLGRRFIRTDRTHGFSYTSMWARPGKPMSLFAEDMLATDDDAIGWLLSEMRRPVIGYGEKVVFIINLTTHDHDEPGMSIRGVGPNASFEGYSDNLRFVIERIDGVWRSLGLPKKDLLFWMVGKHPGFMFNADSEESLTLFQPVVHAAAAATATLALPVGVSADRIAFFDTFASPSLDGFTQIPRIYAPDGNAHLQQIGYDRIGWSMWEASQRAAACPADVNDDGTLDGADFNAWLMAYVDGDLRADQNLDGRLTGADLSAWSAFYSRATGCDE